MNDEAVYRSAPATPGLLNITRIKFFMTQHFVLFLIMDMESAMSDVNGRKTKN